MFENNGHIHVNSSGAGAGYPLGSIFFHLHIYSVNFCCKFSPLNDFVKVKFSPFKYIGDPS